MTSGIGRPLRLLFLTGFLGHGGSERQLYLLLRHLDPTHFERHVVVFNESPNRTYDAPLREAGVRIWPLPPDCKGVRRRSVYLYRRFRALRPDIVHSWTFHDNPYAALIGRLAGVPVRWGSLRNALHAVEAQRLPPLYRWLSLRAPQRLVVNAHALAGQVVAAGVPTGRVTVLPNCLPLPEPDLPPPDLSAWGIDGRHQLIGIIGNLRHQKNHALFVAALARLLPHYPDARGLIIGQPLPRNPGVAADIHAAIAAHNLTDRIHLLGFRDDVPALLQRLDVVALTSHYEGLPNAVLEAQAAGCPVVATRVGGVPELIEDGVTGHIVPPGDPTAFAAALARLLDDPPHARDLAVAARAHVARRHGCATIAAQASRLYMSAVGHGE